MMRDLWTSVGQQDCCTCCYCGLMAVMYTLFERLLAGFVTIVGEEAGRMCCPKGLKGGAL